MMNSKKIPEEKRKKIALGGACSIRVGDRNYVVRAGKRDWRGGVDGDSARYSLVWSGYARRPPGCM